MSNEIPAALREKLRLSDEQLLGIDASQRIAEYRDQFPHSNEGATEPEYAKYAMMLGLRADVAVTQLDYALEILWPLIVELRLTAWNVCSDPSKPHVLAFYDAIAKIGALEKEE